MVKAKDLLEKGADEFEEDDKVNEAYESLSKKLEDLRKDSDDSEEKDDDMSQDKEDKESSDAPDSAEAAAKGEEAMEDKEEEKDKDMEDEEEEEAEEAEKEEESDEPKETFTKSQEDPLDAGDKLSEQEVDELNKKETSPEEDTLDDLAEEKTESEESASIHRLGDANKDRYFSETSPLGGESFSPKYPGLTRPKGSSKIHIFILGLIGLAIIGGTVYLLRSQFGEQTPTPTPTPDISVTTPTPQPTPEALDRSKFKIRVLNGTTKTGLAASVSAKLKDLGYQTDKVGNATNSAFQTTLVRVKPSASGLVDQLIRDLAPDFESASSTELKDSDSADGEVILGAK